MHDLSKVSIGFGALTALGLELIVHAVQPESHTLAQEMSTLLEGYAVGATFGYASAAGEELCQWLVNGIKFSREYAAYAKAVVWNTALPLALYAGIQSGAVQQIFR